MEPESSSPYPQVTAIRPYPKPTPSSPHDPLQLPGKELIRWQNLTLLLLALQLNFWNETYLQNIILTYRKLGFYSGKNLYSVITQKTTTTVFTSYVIKLVSATFTMLKVAHNCHCYTETTEW